MSKKVIIWVVVIVVVVLAAAYYFYYSPQNYQTNSVSPVQTGQPVTQISTTTVTTVTATTTTSVKIVTAPQTRSISIANFSFNPNALTVNKGDTVVWTNNDSVPHQIAGGVFNGQPMGNGQTFSFAFDTAGAYNYHCAIHPSMTGTITVK